MPKAAMGIVLALGLAGCAGYFDQRPSNVRPENEAVAAVLGAPHHTAVAEPIVTSLAPQPAQDIPAAPAPAQPAPPPAPMEPAPAVASVPPAAPPPAEPVMVPSSTPEVAVPPASPPPPAPSPTAVPPPPEPEPAPSVVVSNPVPPPPQAVEAQPAFPPSALNPESGARSHCAAVSKQRSDDAAASGLDSDTQAIVRDGTYRNCMSWQAAHPLQ